MRMIVPVKVAKAFDYHKKMWKIMNPSDINLMFMAIPFARVSDRQTLILKKFAHQNPTLYLNAVLHGYKGHPSLEEELAEMISDWLDKPYVNDEKRDIEQFAEKVTNFFQQQL